MLDVLLLRRSCKLRGMGQKYKMLAKITLLLPFMVMALSGYAQVDTEFWFVAPEVTKGHADSPVYIRITAVNDANVTITFPATGETLLNNHSVKAGEQYSFLVPNGSNGEPKTENKPAGVVNSKGLLITSTDEITAYYEIADNKGHNPDKFTLKGENALGTEFLIPSQTNFQTRDILNPRATEEIDIVATEANTTIEVVLSQDDDQGHSAGDVVTIVLNKGESYAFTMDASGINPNFGGSVITSDKPIAVTISDDSIQKPGDGSYDLVGDQLVPIAVIGEEYIAVNTQIRSEDVSEVSVWVTEDNTLITVDGTTAAGGPFNRGDHITIPIVGAATYIKADKPVYAYQFAGVTGNGANNELGSAIIPPITGCTGSKDVSFRRNLTDAFYVQLLVQGKHRSGFTMTLQQGGGKPATDYLNSQITWTLVPGSGSGDEAWYVANVNLSDPQIVTTAPYVISNSLGLFHMGVLDENGASMSYGYFSSFSNLELAGETQQCDGNSIELRGIGNSLIKRYVWRYDDGINDPAAEMHEGLIYDAKVSGTYYLDGYAYGGCKLTEQIEVEFIVPEVDLGEDQLVCPGPDNVITFDVTAGYQSYSWSSNVAVDPVDRSVATFEPIAGVPTTIEVTVVGDELGCTTKESVVIEGYDEAEVDLNINGGDVCLNDVIRNVEHDPSYNYKWTFNGTPITSQPDDREFLIAKQAGQYEVEVSTSQNCISQKNTGTITVYEIELDPLTDLIECPNNNVTYTAQARKTSGGAVIEDNPSGIVYKWTQQDGTLLQNGSINTYAFNQPAIFKVEAEDANGCRDESLFVNYEWHPEVTVPSDGAEFCKGAEPVELSIQPGLSSYLWTKNTVPLATTNTYSTSPSMANDSHGGTYSISALDANNCPVSTTIEVSIVTTPTIDLLDEYEVCEGDNLSLEADPGFDSYNWELNGTTVSGSPSIKIDNATQAGNYTFTGELVAGGCSDNKTISITVLPKPEVALPATVGFCPNSLVTLSDISGVIDNSPGNITYLWNTGATTEELTVNQEGNYWLQIFKQSTKTSKMCSDMAEVVVNEYEAAPEVTLTNPGAICDLTTHDLVSPLTVPADVAKYGWYSVNEVTDQATLLVENANYTVTNNGGLFRLIVENVNECTNSGDVFINALEGPVIDLGADREMCEGEKLMIQAQPGYEDYVWVGGDPGETEYSRIVNTSETLYQVSVSNNNGICTTTDDVRITVNPLPEVNITSEPICAGQTTNLYNATDVPGVYEYAWSTGLRSSLLTVSDAKDYSTLVTNSITGCSNFGSGSAIIHPIPQTSFPYYGALCPGEILRIEPTVKSSLWSYDWGVNYPDNTADFLEEEFSSEVVILTITDEYDCQSAARVTLSEVPKPYFSPLKDAEFCVGDSVFFEVDNLLHNDYSYSDFSWSRNDVVIEGAEQSNLLVKEGGQYRVEAYTGCHWVDTTVTVKVYENPIAVVDTSIYAQVALFPGAGLAPYEFSSNGEFGPWQKSNTFSSLESGEYVFRVRDQNSCFYEDTVELNNIIDIDVVNYVTDNGDGINDTWDLEGLEKFPNSIITVYTRYGKVVCKQTAAEPDWDGRYLGQPLPVDSYWYVIELKPIDKIMQGHVTIKR